MNLENEILNFDKNYGSCKKKCKIRICKKKRHVVITNNDVRQLQTRLSKGTIDISKPFAKNNLPE